MITESTVTRYLFLDNIKVLFTILVIFWHTMVTYGDVGWWYYKESNPVDPFSEIFFLLVVSIGGVFQTSLLGLFFLLGGYFTPKSYDRKGVRSFWKDRLIRLGIPLILYIVLINPFMIYILSKLGIPPWSTNPMLQGTFLDFYISSFLSWDNFINFISFGGPMWFLRVLLIFTVLYTLWRQITKLNSVQRKIPEVISIPRYSYLILLAIGLGCLTFLIRIVFPIDVRPLEIPWGQIIQYLTMFSIGVICIRYLWFEMVTKEHVKIWLITIIVSLVIIFIDFFIAIAKGVDLVDFTGGANLHAFLFALVDNVISMGVIFVLIKIFYAKFNKQGPILRNLSISAYHMYLLHPLILVALSLGFASIDLYPIIKIAIIFPLTVIFCYLVSHYVVEKINLKKHMVGYSKSQRLCI
ncbi:MAG: acyltransferase family protein [Candidatus Thorarchaeota archaeon]